MSRQIEGKIPHGLLKKLLSTLTPPGREVIIGPAVGEDAFAAAVGPTAVVGSTDPITFTAKHIGYYAVNVNANDVATMGAQPRWFLSTVLVPPGTGKRELALLFREIDVACVQLGVRLLGGHTEITSTVTQPVVMGAMVGTAKKRKLIRPERSRPGDRVLMTKRLALEGTSIIASERSKDVEGLLGKRRASRARRFLFSPGISIVKEALSAAASAPVHAMHDPTEGGLLWGVKELCLTTGTGIEIDLGSVPVYEETRAICEHFDLNPLGLIASGSLLIAVSERHAGKVARAIQRKGIECADIGRLWGERPVLLRKGKPVKFPALKADEISRLFQS